MSAANETPTAALLIIGNEILSGRTQDANLSAVAIKLGSVGIALKEVRVVPDIEAEIIAGLNALRKRYTYVFTTGGIGPTHDDITIDAIAVAFGVPVIESAEAISLLASYYGDENLTNARRRMARVPEGASLIANPISHAPGVKIENVYIMAGVPNIMQAMMDGVAVTLRHGPLVHSMTVSGFIGESMIAEELAEIAKRYSALDIGSYPWVRQGKFGTALVTRGTDKDLVRQASEDIRKLVESRNVEVTLTEG